jgi:tetratricopeptide (TPR) repeat protein
MKTSDRPRGRYSTTVFSILLLVGLLSSSGFAQSAETKQMRTKASELFEAMNYTDALPLLEKLAVLMPLDASVHRDFGFTLIAMARITKDPAEAKQFRARSRAAFVKARDNGDASPLITGLIESTPVDGGDETTFSSDKEVNDLMTKAETAFASGKMDEALDYYQAAYRIDPKLYHAALFSGDVYVKKEKYPEAEVWYQKAIRIDPNIETAYRYSATPLMKQKRYDEARDRYVEAWITEPYSRFALQGIVQWGEITNTPLAHPQVEPPKTTVGPDGKQNTTINVSPLADDGSLAWIAYSATRESWRKEKFAKAYPGEPVYRHSLREEAEALRDVVAMAKTLKPKRPNAQIETIAKLDKDGLLEAFILLALPDNGIAKDHPAYLATDRAKLRQYVVKYVIGNGK